MVNNEIQLLKAVLKVLHNHNFNLHEHGLDMFRCNKCVFSYNFYVEQTTS